MFSFLLSFPVLAALSSLFVHAKPLPRQSWVPSALTRSQIDEFAPFTRFASAAYCHPNTISSWRCGADCDANSDFNPEATGGDGVAVQFWYVGFSQSLDSVVVAHQGTDISRIQPLLTDANFPFENLDPELFPGVPSSLLVHSGFADDHARSALQILSAVRDTISKYNSTNVTIVGHSLGGALALLDSVFLPLHVSGVSFRTVTYGMPRVGNRAFANYVDSHVTLTHINNKEDPVPLIPSRLLGYQHASGEIHIDDDEEWFSCPGQENLEPECSAGGIRIVLNDHSGPYGGVIMGAGC